MTNRSLKRPSNCKQSRKDACPKSKLGTLKVELAVCQEESEEECEQQCSQSEEEEEECPQPCPPPCPAPCKTTPQCPSDSSCQSKASGKISACCRPGCSKRMPCLSCTKKGCIGEAPGRDGTKRERKCQKSCNTSSEKFKIRSKSEARASNCGGGGSCKLIKETCCGDSKKECHPKKRKPCKKPKEKCEPPPSSCDEVEVCQAPPVRKSKSPCRQLKACPCDDCRNVRFNEKCETIPGPYSSCDNSCDEEEACRRGRRKQNSKKARCPPPCEPKQTMRPRSKSCSPNACRDKSPCPQEKFGKACDCIVCSLGQSSASNFMGFDDQITNGMQLKLPQSFASHAGSMDWPPPTAPCNCGSPNCSTTFRFSSSRF